MNMTTGDLIALTTVALNALAYLVGISKLNETVSSLKETTKKLEDTLNDFSTRLRGTEKSIGILENNCLIYHGKEML